MANLVKIWWTTKLLTRNLMDSSYISFFRDSTPFFFLHSYLNNIELLSILLQNYNPVATKTDIGRRKDEGRRLNCRWNTFGRKSHRQQTLCCFCVGLMFAFNSAFFHTSGKSCWKSFMVACKHMKKNTQVVQSASSDVSVSWYRRLDKLTDTSPLAYAVIFVTRCSHIRNPTQPYS